MVAAKAMTVERQTLLYKIQFCVDQQQICQTQRTVSVKFSLYLKVDLKTKLQSRRFSQKTNERIRFSILNSSLDRKTNVYFPFWVNLQLNNFILRSTDL